MSNRWVSPQEHEAMARVETMRDTIHRLHNQTERLRGAIYQAVKEYTEIAALVPDDPYHEIMNRLHEQAQPNNKGGEG